MFTWLKSLFSKIPPAIEKPLWALVVAVLVYFAAQWGITVPPAVITTTEAYYVAEATQPLLNATPTEGPHLHPIVGSLARFVAAGHYHREHPELSFAECHHLAHAVPDSAIIAKAAEQGVSTELEGLKPQGRISDWLAAHPDFIANLVKLLMILIPLFA